MVIDRAILGDLEDPCCEFCASVVMKCPDLVVYGHKYITGELLSSGLGNVLAKRQEFGEVRKQLIDELFKRCRRSCLEVGEELWCIELVECRNRLPSDVTDRRYRGSNPVD